MIVPPANLAALHRTRGAAKDALAMSSVRIAELLPRMAAAHVLEEMREFHAFIAAADTDVTKHWKSDRDVWLDFRIARKRKELLKICWP